MLKSSLLEMNCATLIIIILTSSFLPTADPSQYFIG